MENLLKLRRSIDSVDLGIIQLLRKRSLISTKIGKYKALNGIESLDKKRWQKVLKNRKMYGKKIGLNEEFIADIYSAIHIESLRLQSKDIKESVSDQLKKAPNNLLLSKLAHMEFETPKFIVESISNRSRKNNLGYFYPTESQYNSVVSWQLTRNNSKVNKDWIIFSQSSTFSLAMSILSISNEGDIVLMFTPSYPSFYRILKYYHRKILTSELIVKTNRAYEINFKDFEKKLKKCKLLLLCNPHNPTGKQFSILELKRIINLCEKYKVKVISDEVHSDITYGNKHNVILNTSKYALNNSMVIFSIGKTFNSSGLKISYIIIKNKTIRETLKNHMKNNGGSLPNIFGLNTLEACYTQGQPWLNSTLKILKRNYLYLSTYFKENRRLEIMKNEATYLAWINCNKIEKDDKKLVKFLEEQFHVQVAAGSDFGKAGNGYIRLNFAVSTSNLKKALIDLKDGLICYEKNNLNS